MACRRETTDNLDPDAQVFYHPEQSGNEVAALFNSEWREIRVMISTEKHVKPLLFLLCSFIRMRNEIEEIKNKKDDFKLISGLQHLQNREKIASILAEALELMGEKSIAEDYELKVKKEYRLDPLLVCLFKIYVKSTANDINHIMFACKPYVNLVAYEDASKSQFKLLEVFYLLINSDKLTWKLRAGRADALRNYRFLKPLVPPTNPALVKEVKAYGDRFGVTGPIQERGDVGVAETLSGEEVMTLSDDEEETIDKPYPMNPPHETQGLCIIINNEKFHPPDPLDPNSNSGPRCSDRPGSNNDATELDKVFTSFGFQTVLYTNLSRDQMQSVFTKYAAWDHARHRGFVFCVLSHGEDNHAYGSNHKLLSLSDMIEMYSDENCPTLQGKFKLFFFQTCQGGAIREVQIDSGELARDSQRILEQSQSNYNIQGRHTLLMYPALPGYASWRDHQHGSWFIQILCRNLDKYGNYFNLDSILNKTKREISEMVGRHLDRTVGQCAWVMSTLEGDVKLQRFRARHYE